MAQKSDAAVVMLADGKRTNARLHEQMTEGVDDREIRLRTKKILYDSGVPMSVLDKLLPA